MGKKRERKILEKTPSNDVAQFLSSELDRRGWDVSEFCERLKAAGWKKNSVKTVYAWRSGTNQIPLDDLQFIALALGYGDWLGLAAAVKRFGLR